MYNSAPETRQHIFKVRTRIAEVLGRLFGRAVRHDASKTKEPEKSIYDTVKPRITFIEKEYGYGSPAYEAVVKELAPAFEHHFKNNRHHPEFYENGVNGMTLIDLVEMLCDWKAASERYGNPINLEANKKRFGISDQLAEILNNTVRYMEW